ncbi:glycosyltransferase [Mucilaginibacter lacusdianchii]|uniref:glycosyltransferase n=1 Tax=Mucilaginibacter lacusdianchii TaxID=2684211 RepID=UPI00131B04BA|nr:glycosyltransferase [Mucilaginibacter sp. JXJ CY 39]
MISIIICSVKKNLREAIVKNIEDSIGVEHEVIVIENEKHKYPIAKAYNIGAQQAKYPYLCFSHEDIKFHTKNWGQILIDDFTKSKARLIGVLGCAVKVSSPSSVYLACSNLNCQNHLQSHPNRATTLSYENPFEEKLSKVCILDGLFIASTRQAWAETKFSEEYLTGFHGYDIDFSIKNFLLGDVVVTYNFLLEHFSHGSFNKSWVSTHLRLTDIWEEKLPLKAPNVSDEALANAELLNLKEFMTILINTDYNFLTQLRYALKHFKKAPFEKINFYYLRRMILRNKLNSSLKAIFKPKLNF